MWTGFLSWCDRRDVDPCEASVPQIADFFLYLRQELSLSVPAVKGYRAALNLVFSLTGMDLAASTVVFKMFHSFKRSCPLREIRPLDWNLSLVLQYLSRSPFEPLKLASDKPLTWKTSFLPALASARRVSELYGLSFRVHHSRGWSSCTFSLPNFVAKTQNPSVPDSRFKESRPLTTLLVAIEMTCTGPGRSNIVLTSKVCSSRRVGVRNGCPETPFLSGCAR